MAAKSQMIQDSILREVFWRANSPVRVLTQQYGLTRQAIQRHIKTLIKEGRLAAEGSRRYCRYKLPVERLAESTFPLGGSVSEDHVWDQLIRPVLSWLSTEELNIAHYGLTEMFNNAIDHSQGATAMVRASRTPISLTLVVQDDGEGIFQKIARTSGLTDPRQSLLELSKGKFTTDPARHTGEGIFFTSRLFDRFRIRSDELLFHHSTRENDWLVDIDDKSFKGTRVTMSLLLPTSRQMQEVISRYSSGPDDFRFSKTHVPLKLATYGDEALISRSAAKRVLVRVDRFDEVLLDFASVRTIGQAFADEIFRVFGNAHPKIQLIAINANEQVTQMIRRAKSAQQEQSLFD